MNNRFLALDCDSDDEARALHRVVRALHDGACPSCASIFPSEQVQHGNDERCPACGFTVTQAEREAVMQIFRSRMSRSLEIFNQWRESVRQSA